MSPCTLLEKELSEYEESLNKSINLFKYDKIDEETHNTHKKNLIPLIAEYKNAIIILKRYEVK